MSTPLEVIQEASVFGGLINMTPDPNSEAIVYFDKDIKDYSLALLQALHDELEGNRLTVDDFENSVYGRYPEFCAGMNQQNQFIQNQQDNLQALMDSIRVCQQ